MKTLLLILASIVLGHGVAIAQEPDSPKPPPGPPPPPPSAPGAPDSRPRTELRDQHASGRRPKIGGRVNVANPERGELWQERACLRERELFVELQPISRGGDRRMLLHAVASNTTASGCVNVARPLVSS